MESEDQKESYVIFIPLAGEVTGFEMGAEELRLGEKELCIGVLGGKLTGVRGMVGIMFREVGDKGGVARGRVMKSGIPIGNVCNPRSWVFRPVSALSELIS